MRDRSTAHRRLVSRAVRGGLRVRSMIGLALACALAVSAGCRLSGATSDSPELAPPRFGQPVTADDIARLDLRVDPAGRALPEGQGTAVEGERLYVAKCLRCHGLDGAGKPADRLVGGVGSLREVRAIKTVGSYWPHAPIVFDYIRRAMPYDRPGSLSNDETYALTAYLLAENGIIARDQELNASTLAAVEMPNRDGFFDAPGWSGNPDAD